MKVPVSSVVFLMIYLLLIPGGSAFSEEITPNLSLGADFRYRHELIDAEGKEQRNRQRIRVRVNLAAKLHDEVSMKIQFASGSDDPVSTNQTLGGGFSKKQVNIDQAYFEWKPEKYEGFSMSGGKVGNPFRTPGKTELLWDGDLRPEGFTLGCVRSAGFGSMFVNAAYFWVEERKTDNDGVLLGGQAGVSMKSQAGQMLLGIGYFDYQNTKTYTPFYDAGDSFGNSVDNNGKYLYDFNDLEIFCEVTPHGLIENVTVFGDFVTNIAEGVDKNQGWLTGAAYSTGKKPGGWDFRYSFRYLEKDALIGAFTDSDFIAGGTDGEGHEINAGYQISSKTKLGVSYFNNKHGIENGKEYQRLQVDVNFKL